MASVGAARDGSEGEVALFLQHACSLAALAYIHTSDVSPTPVPLYPDTPADIVMVLEAGAKQGAPLHWHRQAMQ